MGGGRKKRKEKIGFEGQIRPSTVGIGTGRQTSKGETVFIVLGGKNRPFIGGITNQQAKTGGQKRKFTVQYCTVL